MYYTTVLHGRVLCNCAAGEDYISETNPIALSTDRSPLIKIAIVNDRTFELTETFLISLFNHTALPPRVALNQMSATVTILDNDGES